MCSGYGACEDRGCGNVGSVQEVSTHTLICYIMLLAPCLTIIIHVLQDDTLNYVHF